jgi:hypothetical protein
MVRKSQKTGIIMRVKAHYYSNFYNVGKAYYEDYVKCCKEQFEAIFLAHMTIADMRSNKFAQTKISFASHGNEESEYCESEYYEPWELRPME